MSQNHDDPARVRQAQERADALVRGARELLASGRPREAQDAFGRVLLLDPAHDGARAGQTHAALAAAEERRRLDAALDEARHALAGGDAGRARRLLQEVLDRGGDRDAALALLDGLEAAGLPAVVLSLEPAAAPGSPVSTPARARRGPEWRRTLSTAWVALFAVLVLLVVSGWERQVDALTRAPRPRPWQPAATLTFPAATVGERALSLARARFERGDLAGAQAALDRVPPEDPLYPLAAQMRTDMAGARPAVP